MSVGSTLRIISTYFFGKARKEMIKPEKEEREFGMNDYK